MLQVIKDISFEGTQIPFGVLDVQYPIRAQWDENSFQVLKDRELHAIAALAEHYDRKEVFGEDPYFRYFKKFKKTYPIVLQLESFLRRERPFPSGNPVNEVAFLAELKTRMLLGTHDVDQVRGKLTLFRGTEKEPFCGMGGRDAHIYPGDLSGRDNDGIILSMIAGADDRTCVSSDTRHAVYFVFGVDGMNDAQVQMVLDLLVGYVKTLAPSAQYEMNIVSRITK